MLLSITFRFVKLTMVCLVFAGCETTVEDTTTGSSGGRCGEIGYGSTQTIDAAGIAELIAIGVGLGADEGPQGMSSDQGEHKMFEVEGVQYWCSDGAKCVYHSVKADGEFTCVTIQ